MSQTTIPPLTRFLLPVDGSPSSNRAVSFAGCLAVGLGSRVKGITVLHALAGHYLSDHLANVDHRAADILESSLFKRLREAHLAGAVGPMVTAAEKELQRVGVKVPVDHKTVDGDPAEQIAKAAGMSNCSTIVMGRRGLSPMRELFLGSVTASLLHRPHRATVFVVGEEVETEGACLLPTVLVPMDGSVHSQAAVQEAAILGSAYGQGLQKISLLRVIDLAHLAERVERGEKPDAEAEKMLRDASSVLAKAGIAPEKIETMVEYGRPVEMITRIADEKAVTLIIMGRRGRSTVRELVTGSVSRDILHRCSRPTVAIVG